MIGRNLIGAMALAALAGASYAGPEPLRRSYREPEPKEPSKPKKYKGSKAAKKASRKRK